MAEEVVVDVGLMGQTEQRPSEVKKKREEETEKTVG